LTFASSEKWINGKSEVIGNPVLFDKSTIDIKKARDAFNIKEGDFVLTVTGGSGGAKIINDTFLKIASSLKEIKVIWSTGVNNFEEIKEGAKDYPNISVYAFIDKMDELLSISNLVLSRAGATSIAELSYMGVPGVLIPYKWAAENHQVLNAEFVINGGGGVMIEDDNLSEELLLKTLNELINNKKKLEKMASDMGSLFGSDIKERIVDLIKREICTA
jgi:UDP-N-acetylglucosamine--N-acetylmuramyl-(pentapeptide) pyrophosphoryl-undecaprenol N-acetylglucosamine transferase